MSFSQKPFQFIAFFLLLPLILLARQSFFQRISGNVFDHDPDEHIGQRPYEMGDRPGYQHPLVDFEDLQGWWIHSQNGASARLYRSRVQQMDGRYVAKVLYRGEDGTSAFEFGPPNPIPISKDANNVGVWIYGNNWAWQPLNIKPLPDMLPFLTTQETILPIPHDSVFVKSRLERKQFIATHTRDGSKMTFRYLPKKGTLDDFSVQTNSGQNIQPFVNGGIQFQLPLSAGKNVPEKCTLVRVEQKDGRVIYRWLFSRGGIKIPYQIGITARYNSLLIDVAVPQADRAKGLQFGNLKSSAPCKPVRVPMLTYGLPDPQVVCSGDVFVFALLDHYRSHASMLYAANEVLSPKEVKFNGGSRYLPKTDGHRNSSFATTRRPGVTAESHSPCVCKLHRKRAATARSSTM